MYPTSTPEESEDELTTLQGFGKDMVAHRLGEGDLDSPNDIGGATGTELLVDVVEVPDPSESEDATSLGGRAPPLHAGGGLMRSQPRAPPPRVPSAAQSGTRREPSSADPEQSRQRKSGTRKRRNLGEQERPRLKIRLGAAARNNTNPVAQTDNTAQTNNAAPVDAAGQANAAQSQTNAATQAPARTAAPQPNPVPQTRTARAVVRTAAADQPRRPVTRKPVYK